MLPVRAFKQVKAAKNFQAGLGMVRQLFFGAMDMHLHSDKYDPSGDKSVFAVQHELAKQYTVMPPLPEDRFLCSFSHIFAGGYSAGYYSYKWAEVMSADAFAAFEEAGLDNEKVHLRFTWMHISTAQAANTIVYFLCAEKSTHPTYRIVG